MIDIKLNDDGVVELSGRLDASQTDNAREVLDKLDKTTVIDLSGLDYVASAGIGILLFTQKRLAENGEKIIFKNMNNHIKDVFKYAGLDQIFDID